MKRIITRLLALSIITAISACGGNPHSSNNSNGNASTSSVSDTSSSSNKQSSSSADDSFKGNTLTTASGLSVTFKPNALAAMCQKIPSGKFIAIQERMISKYKKSPLDIVIDTLSDESIRLCAVFKPKRFDVNSYKMTKMYEYGDFWAKCLRNWRIFCTFALAKVDGCREEKA